MATDTDAKRIYDKGERRHKHVGSGDGPVIAFDDRDPKKWVGKCPSNLSDELKTSLLNEAVAAPLGGRELDCPKRLYVVHNGAIYEAQTSDGGVSYHGYPYRGRLSGELIEKLAKMAEEKSCGPAFDKWVKQHVTRYGGRR
ncbi:MAG TPA: hypothetical protein VK446_05965 [Methylocystis sp.]|nr:hypothetical protein [Methylocystis sp.]